MYLADMDLGVWVGAVTTLLGGLLGGAISLVLSRQQIKASRAQQEADRANQDRQRNIDRRFQIYSDFLIRSRSFRNALKAFYLPSAQTSSIETIDDLLRSAQDAAVLVFLVSESEEMNKACVSVVRALGSAQAIVHGLKKPTDPWRKLNLELGRAIRTFQVSARNELGISGPSMPWGARDNFNQETAQPDDSETNESAV